MIERIHPFGGTVLRTSLSSEDEAKLRAASAGQDDPSSAKL